MAPTHLGNLITTISPNDEMLGGNEPHYFGVGQSALDCINCSLAAAGVAPGSIRRILDMPCGHGRVMRYLRAAFPEAEITACDLLRDGVDFCAETFGAIPNYSEEDPTKIRLGGDFDLIWVGSLLTHLDAKHWHGFLELFRRSLRPSGVLVFSAHGREVYDRTTRGTCNYGLPWWQNTAAKYSYERTGFGYENYGHSNSYGVSFSTPAWVFKQIEQVSELRIVHFSEGAWDKHHDIYACGRDPDWQVTHPPTSQMTYLRHKVRVVQRLRNLKHRMVRALKS